MAKAAEQATGQTIFAGALSALMSIMGPVGDPISPPTPRAKPEQKVEDAPSSHAPAIIAQCGYATIVSALAKDGKTPVFRAAFAGGMVDEMVSEGCSQFFQGCNVCSVRYEECSAAERAACTDVACLEKSCERNVICSAKQCEARGGPPTCKSRIARTQCIKTIF